MLTSASMTAADDSACSLFPERAQKGAATLVLPDLGARANVVTCLPEPAARLCINLYMQPRCPPLQPMPTAHVHCAACLVPLLHILPSSTHTRTLPARGPFCKCHCPGSSQRLPLLRLQRPLLVLIPAASRGSPVRSLLALAILFNHTEHGPAALSPAMSSIPGRQSASLQG
jgi:hypothetical protein